MADRSHVSSRDLAWWEKLGTLPVAAGVLVFLNALYILLVAFNNVTDYDANEPFVEHVLSMDTTNFGAEPGTNLDDDVMWRAIGNDTLHTIAYVLIIAWEWLAAIVLATATAAWLTDRGRGYRAARALSTIGLLMILLLFFGGFIAIGGEWFLMWKSEAWNGLDAAFRNTVLAALALVLVHLPSAHWASASPIPDRGEPV